MNTFTKALIAATIAVGAVSAQAAQGELYQFNDGPAVARTVEPQSNVVFKFDEQGLYDKAIASTATRATVKAMINDANGLNSLVRG
jgi:hypothetical protein